MSCGDVHGDASNFGNYNSGVIATTVNIETLIQSNTSTLESLSQRYRDTNWPRSPKAAYNASLREACTPGTRVDILKRIYGWAEDPSSKSPSVFWLTGEAGSGKSTIAYSVAHHFDGQEGGAPKLLGANFFCSRQLEETRRKANIIPTIVEQLARRSQSYAHALLKANKFDSSNFTVKQMKDLLVDPWMQSVSGRHVESPPLLVLVDALDEIEDRGGSTFLEELLKITSKSQLQGIRFFITSRPDAEIAKLCSSFTSDAVCALYDVPVDTVNVDIATYLQAKLPELQGTPEVDELMRQAAGLFIFAATAVRYITPRARMTKKEQIKLLGKLGIHTHGSTVSPNAYASPIDALYKQVMFTAFEGLDDDLFKIERISTSVAGELQSDDPDMAKLVKVVVDDLCAVLYVKDDRVLWYHASFPDFIFSQRRSGSILLGSDSRIVDMHCEEAAHHACLSRSCFRIMKSHLRFNICNLPSSFLLDSEVPDLINRIQVNIGDSLRYSCFHWAQHLARTSSDDRRTEIRDFLHLEVLFWIEAMNLLDAQAQCTPMLQQAREYLLKCDGGGISNLTQEVLEAANFATYFGGSPSSQSTPHLYISSLATWSGDSTLSRMWKKHFSHIPAFEQTGGEGSLSLLTIKGEHGFDSVAFSSDGTRIGSVSRDNLNTVSVWDASTGAELRRLEGHSEYVTSIAFSRDGTHVVSGSRDKSVRVWDASTGAELRKLEGHSGDVWSVAFSGDGTRIVSGSQDKSVRVWDASTGAELRKLEGHSEPVSSVAFSVDGTRIVSSSEDKSVRVWDASTGAELRKLKGHSKFVSSVAFSVDGTHIVSGSHDQSVRIWDASTGPELRRLNLDDYVNSVAFSSDGTCIVFGSDDVCVAVWDTSTGELRSLYGHEGCVRSAAFSGNGTRIVSGSDDRSLRVWDASRRAKPRKQEGHSDDVWSVAFSGDGTRIVSGSEDKSVRVWDASTGVELRRWDGSGYPVAFSNDGTCILSGSIFYPLQSGPRGNFLKLWNTSTGAELRGLWVSASDFVTSVSFSSDGTRIVSGSRDNSVRVWDAVAPIVPWYFSDDGSWIMSESQHPQRLMWAPQDIMKILLQPYNLLKISSEPSARVEFNDSRIGPAWVACYTPQTC